MTKVLVTGAAGFIGRNLVADLVREGHAVSGCDVRQPAVSGPGRFERIDLLEADRLARFVAEIQPEIVMHFGARTDLVGTTMADYAANTDGVRNVITACTVPSVRRVIFASSRMVCRIDHVPRDYGDYSPPNPYGRSKVEGELLVKQADVPFEWVIVRPTSIWGPGFGIPYRNFFDQVRKRRYVHPGAHRPRKSFGFVGNTTFQLERLMMAPGTTVNRRTFYLGDYEPLDVAEWASQIHAAFGLPGRVRTVPMPVLRVVAKVGDLMNRLTRKDVGPLTTFRLNNLITNMVYPQLAELHAVTGDLPFDWRTGTDRTVAWMKSADV